MSRQSRNTVMRIAIFFTIFLFPWLVAAKQSPYEEFVSQISPAAKDLVQILQIEGPHIEQLARAKTSANTKALRAVTASGLLLKALIASEKKYFALDMTQLQQANRFLLQIDDDISKGTGYGNLLLKSQIVEMIIESMHRSMAIDDKDRASLDSISNTLDSLRYHLPDQLASKYIMAEALGLPQNLRNINAHAESPAEQKTGAKDLIKKLRAKTTEAEITAYFTQSRQIHKNATNLYALYEKPGYLQLVSVAEGYSISWMLLKAYCNKLIEKGTDFHDWKKLPFDWYHNAFEDNDPWVKYINLGLNGWELDILQRDYRYKGYECYRYKKCN